VTRLSDVNTGWDYRWVTLWSIILESTYILLTWPQL
jgi:hypothetical protein